MIGKKISHYSVTTTLGEGSLAGVYRATDTKLCCDVALKVLPEAFAPHAEPHQARPTSKSALLSISGDGLIQRTPR